MDHDIIVEYTISDDGIHLSCSCGWDSGGLWFPTPESLVELSNKHRANPEGAPT